jgi:hypothetical protein
MSTKLETEPLLKAKNGIIELPNGGKIRTFPPSPRGFDALAASDADLAAHGFPARPTDAKRLAAWQRAVRHLRLVEPTFQPLTAPRQAPHPHRPAINDVSSKLAGSIVPSADPVVLVKGIFTMPNVDPPRGAVDGTPYTVSCWVSIYDDPTVDALQLGCDGFVFTRGGVISRTIAPFWQWAPGGAFSIPSLPVLAGDTLLCYINQHSTTAFLLLANKTSNVGTSFEVTAPLLESLTGKYGAWAASPLSPPNIASFGQVYFDLAEGLTAHGNVIQADLGDLFDLVNASGTVLASTAVEAPGLIRITQ